MEKQLYTNSSYDLGNPNNYLIGLFFPVYRLVKYFKLRKKQKNSARQILTGYLIYFIYSLLLLFLSLGKTFIVIVYLIVLIFLLVNEYKNLKRLQDFLYQKEVINDVKKEIDNTIIDSILIILGGILILSALYLVFLPVIVYCFSYAGYMIVGFFCIMTAFLIPVGLELFEQAKQLEINYAFFNIYGFMLLLFGGISLPLFSLFRKK